MTGVEQTIAIPVWLWAPLLVVAAVTIAVRHHRANRADDAWDDDAWDVLEPCHGESLERPITTTRQFRLVDWDPDTLAPRTVPEPAEADLDALRLGIVHELPSRAS